MAEDIVRRQIDNFVDVVKNFFGDKLSSLIIYGSYARGEFIKWFSDINILILVNELSGNEMLNFITVSKKSVKSGLIKPVIFTSAMLKNSWDFFPLQWYEIKKYGIIVCGQDFRDRIIISEESMRAQLKRESRRFYFNLQDTLMGHVDYITVAGMIYKQAKTIQRGLKYLDIKDVEFDYLSKFEDLMKRKFRTFRLMKTFNNFIENHIRMLEKTVLILDSDTDL